MIRKAVGIFVFLSFFVLSFFVFGYGAVELDGGDSLIVADFSGMPGDTVVDSVVAVNPYPLKGFDFRVVYDSTLLIPLVVSPTPRTDYFLTWEPELSQNGWLYLIALTDGLYGGTRPPMESGRGAIAYLVFLVSSDAESGQVSEIKFESAPPKNNSFVDTSFKWILPSLKNGRFTVGPSGVGNGSDCFIPHSLSLSQNYPNPFNSTTAISYAVPSTGQLSVVSQSHITLRVYNIAGQLVRTLVDEGQGPGVYSVSWDGRDVQGHEVGSGVYFYRLKVEGDGLKVSETRRMILLR